MYTCTSEWKVGTRVKGGAAQNCRGFSGKWEGACEYPTSPWPPWSKSLHGRQVTVSFWLAWHSLALAQCRAAGVKKKSNVDIYYYGARPA